MRPKFLMMTARRKKPRRKDGARMMGWDIHRHGDMKLFGEKKPTRPTSMKYGKYTIEIGYSYLDAKFLNQLQNEFTCRRYRS